jgi:hypothetical protein
MFMRLLAVIAVSLLLANVALTGYTTTQQPPAPPSLSDAQLSELDKMFKLATEYRTELENAVGQGTIPESKKASVQELLASHAYTYEQLRFMYYLTKRSKDPQQLVWLLSLEKQFVDPPEYTLTDNNDYKSPSYGKPFVNLTRAKALQQEYVVLSRNFLKDVNASLDPSR